MYWATKVQGTNVLGHQGAMYWDTKVQMYWATEVRAQLSYPQAINISITNTQAPNEEMSEWQEWENEHSRKEATAHVHRQVEASDC